MVNVHEPEWDSEMEQGPFRSRAARVGARAGAEKLGATLYEIPPGAAHFPLHAHHANEEMLVVFSGRPTLRTLEEERVLEPGELVSFPTGRAGTHRLDNRSDEPCRVLMLSTKIAPEIVEYPDSGKVGVSSPAEGLRLLLRADAQMGYFEGETGD